MGKLGAKVLQSHPEMIFSLCNEDEHGIVAVDELLEACLALHPSLP